MKVKILQNVFVVTVAVFLVTMLVMFFVEYRYVSSEQEKEFREQAEYLGSVIEKSGTDVLKAAESTKEIRLRVTVVDADGSVAYDSQEPSAQLPNHAEREEIKEAMAEGKGECKRYSETLGRMTYNYAVRLSDGKVLRVSQECFTVGQLAIRLVYPMSVMLVLVLVFSAFISIRISHRVTRPINAIDPANPELRDAYPELQPLVRRIQAQNRQLYEQMNELKEEHKKQDTMRREFTANVSHELKTPLTSISGYAEILGAGMVEEKDVTRFANKIHDEAQRLIALVGDIIKLSQLDDKDETILTNEPVDLYRVAEEMMSVLSDAASAKHVSVFLSGTHEVVPGSPQIIGEMVYNLIDNAIKYNNENGRVQVTVENDGDGAILIVHDNGIGIPRAELPRVFERFYRVDKSHSKEIGGTGLGLSIVKHGASFHGATVQLDSELGMGTKITIRFPKNAAADTQPNEASADSADAAKPAQQGTEA
ncbi:MAG: ATP-binding protein [Lachnospiraceae bacterium]|nr:ATP-binding protein [Lachnospiraceae bacterium]